MRIPINLCRRGLDHAQIASQAVPKEVTVTQYAQGGLKVGEYIRAYTGILLLTKSPYLGYLENRDLPNYGSEGGRAGRKGTEYPIILLYAA